MEQLGREMVGNCAGLPLAIVILGGILVTKPSLIEWEKVYNDSLSSLKKGKGFGEDYQREVLDILVWSYNDLPPQLKPCFLYLGKYGENEWIEAENLYQLWIAEGMVLSSDRREGETMMQVAESYMGELVHKSMVQVRFNYTESSLIKFESCSLHDLIRTLSITQAKVEDFFEVIDLRERNELGLHTSVDSRFAYSRQLVVHFDEGYTSKQAKHFVKKANQQRYRSMLLFNDFAVRSLPQELGSDLANFRYLRVFALEKVHFDPQTSLCSSLFRIDLARVVGNLVYLRYLSVRGTNLFPWIQNLMLLQTLKLDVQDHIHIPPWLSRNILSKLGHLRHLYLPVKLDHSLRENLKLRLDSLSKLETLENFNTNWCEVKDLPKLICLRKLSLQVGYGFVDLEEMMKYLAALASSSCLQYLGLSIVIEDLGLQNCPDILRQLLGDHNFNLKKLSIIGRLPELAKLFEQQRQQLTTPISVSLICITRLSLSLSRLEEDPMPVLESIPTLCELFLFIKAFVGKEMVCSAPGFLKLTRLVLRGLPHLVKWRIEEGSMRSLSRLKIRECPKLEELPEGLVFLNSLRVLVIEAMPSEFSNRVRMVNGKQGTDFYKVAHVPRLILDNHLISHRS